MQLRNPKVVCVTCADVTMLSIVSLGPMIHVLSSYYYVLELLFWQFLPISPGSQASVTKYETNELTAPWRKLDSYLPCSCDDFSTKNRKAEADHRSSLEIDRPPTTVMTSTSYVTTAPSHTLSGCDSGAAWRNRVLVYGHNRHCRKIRSTSNS